MMEIDCPDCNGSGAIPTMPDGEPEMCRPCNNTGKITVYTEAELKQEREAIIEMIEDYIDNDNQLLVELFKNIRARGNK